MYNRDNISLFLLGHNTTGVWVWGLWLLHDSLLNKKTPFDLSIVQLLKQNVRWSFRRRRTWPSLSLAHPSSALYHFSCKMVFASPHDLVTWPYKTSASSPFWRSTRLYNHFLMIHSFVTPGRCRKYQADVWSISSLHLGCAFGILLLKHAYRRAHKTRACDNLSWFLSVSFYLPRCMNWHTSLTSTASNIKSKMSAHITLFNYRNSKIESNVYNLVHCSTR